MRCYTIGEQKSKTFFPKSFGAFSGALFVICIMPSHIHHRTTANYTITTDDFQAHKTLKCAFPVTWIYYLLEEHKNNKVKAFIVPRAFREVSSPWLGRFYLRQILNFHDASTLSQRCYVSRECRSLPSSFHALRARFAFTTILHWWESLGKKLQWWAYSTAPSAHMSKDSLRYTLMNEMNIKQGSRK